MIQKAHSDGPPGPVMRETRSQPRAESEDIMNKLRRKQIDEAIEPEREMT